MQPYRAQKNCIAPILVKMVILVAFAHGYNIFFNFLKVQPILMLRNVLGSLLMSVGCHFCPLQWGKVWCLTTIHIVSLQPDPGQCLKESWYVYDFQKQLEAHSEHCAKHKTSNLGQFNLLCIECLIQIVHFILIFAILLPLLTGSLPLNYFSLNWSIHITFTEHMPLPYADIKHARLMLSFVEAVNLSLQIPSAMFQNYSGETSAAPEACFSVSFARWRECSR